MFHFLNVKKIFDTHNDKDKIKNILAILIINIVNADNKVTEEELQIIGIFFNKEFNMNEKEIISLFKSVKAKDKELHTTVVELNNILVNDPTSKAKVLQHLNEIIICDSIVDLEYRVFGDIQKNLTS